MIFTESWLRELIDIPVSIEELSEQLTMAGLEIESVESCVAGFSGVVVAEVLAVEAVSGSDKLTVCKVDAGRGNIHTVLCGAPNVRTGGRYPLATPGASLPGGIVIEPVLRQGIRSEGMLCSPDELGLFDSKEGLFELPDDAPVGVALEVYLGLPDTQVEVSLTPNRGDCLGMQGLAREVAVLNQLVFRPQPADPVTNSHDDTRAISLADGTACPRYCGRIIHKVDAGKKTPVVIAERLRRCGIRPISALVDLANYVMLETGQPMHVFDNDRLQGTIEVRQANPGEKIVLLDGSERTLSDNTLVIADQEGPVAMAGIMGGMHSAVGPDTRSIFIESAWFDPQAIMGRARQYGLHTDASHRYERGVDPEMAATAIERLSALLISVCGGQAGPVVRAENAGELPRPRTVRLRLAGIERLLGISVPEERVCKILRSLGFTLQRESGPEPVWQVQVPSHRFDISIEADLVEEVARIHGYQNIQGSSPSVKMRLRLPNRGKTTIQMISAVLAARGYREAINYSFTDPVIQERMIGAGQAVCLMNPISAEMAVMRQSLWPGLLQALLYNVKRQQPAVRLFETGKCYLGHNGQNELQVVAGVIYGNKYKKQWSIDNLLCDFYDLKSDVEAVVSATVFGTELECKPLMHKALHPGQAASIQIQGRHVGSMGTLHPDMQRQYSLPHPAYFFELELGVLQDQNPIKYSKISKYPAVKRDISIVVSEEIVADSLLKSIHSVAGEHLINLELFDVYRGEGIDSGKKSLALGLTFQRSSSTLTDEEADAAISEILQTLHRQFGALLRE